MNRPANAPACFSAASVFAHDSDACRACPAFDACSEASLATLQTIRGYVNVADLLKRHSRARQVSVAPAPQASAASSSPNLVEAERKTPMVKVSNGAGQHYGAMLDRIAYAKSREQFERLARAGLIDIMRKDLHAGRNTFVQSGPKYFRVLIDLLLRGGATKAEYRNALIEELGWAETTAAPHVSITWPGFLAFEFAQELEGRLVLLPATDRHNND